MEILRKLQLTQLRILEEVDRLCRRSGLCYCLNGGTLLGAVRHKGFIPWDDDLDILMPRRDYRRFLALAPAQLDPAYFLDDGATNAGYHLPFAKVRARGTLFEDAALAGTGLNQQICIDIFPHDNAAHARSFRQSLRLKLSRKFGKTMYARRGIVFNNRPLGLVFRPLFLLPNTANYRIAQALASACTDDESAFVISTFSQYGITRHLMPRENIYPCSQVEFEGRMWPAPRDPDFFLRRLYGDYWKLPPEEQRVPMHRGQRIRFVDEAG